MKNNQEIQKTIQNRFLITIGILFVIRIGTFLPVPGINPMDLQSYIQKEAAIQSLISTFSGNNTFVIGLLTLNIFPSINASILVQLIMGFSPQLSKLQKEGDLEGRRTINRLTRRITLLWAILQSVGLTIYLKRVLFNWNYLLAFEIILWLTAGAMIVLWLSEIITDHGLGNGTSILIYTNIIASLPNIARTLFGETNLEIDARAGAISLFLIFGSLYGIIFLQESLQTIPLISSKQLNQLGFNDSVTTKSYLPLRFNQAGVMPIILTTAIFTVPSYILNLGLVPKINLPINLEPLKFLYWILYFIGILVVSAFYSRIVLNPKDISDQLQKMAVTIPGVRPGIQTTFYLKQVLGRTSLVGATILGLLTTVPNFIESTLDLPNLNQLSTTSLLILAGVILDLAREVKNIYYSNIYNNLY